MKVTLQRDEIEQGFVEATKVFRTVVRLRHSIAADREIAARLPELQQLYVDSIQQGVLPDSATVQELVNEALSG